MKILERHRRTADETVATPAEEADREAYEAERAEEAERRDVVVAEQPAAHPITAARERFGGIDLPASLVGMLTAIAIVMLLGGLGAAAVDESGYQTGLNGNDVNEITLASLIGVVAVLFVAFVIGGWTAGRIARYDGARNGLMTAVWGLVLAAVLYGLANVLSNVDLPEWVNRDAITLTTLVSGAAAVAAMLLGGLVGGLWGTRYHRLADETLLDARDPRSTP